MQPTKMTKEEFDSYVENNSTEVLMKEHPFGIVVVDKGLTVQEKMEKFFNEENYLEAFGFQMNVEESPELLTPNSKNLKKFLNQFLNYINQ